MSMPQLSVAVFAYNEENGIGACLDAIGACAQEAQVTVHVLINGCTDGTEASVRAYKPSGFEVVPVVIRRGDKSNAWNHYVHEVAPLESATHVFTDGDCRMVPGTLRGFLSSFGRHPEAMGCAALPVSGRSQTEFRAKLARGREMAGNLYALRSEAVRRFREIGVRLPFGMFGEDGLVTMLVKHDLDPRSPRREERIAVSEEGGFAFEPLSPLSLRDLKTYRNRKMRYAVRRQQANMLYPLLFEHGVSAMPEHVVDLYRARHAAMEMGWNGLSTYFDWKARRRIERDLRADDSVKQAERAHLYS
ncbi:glycosyltransferase family 2 protein [Sabulicella rubraurantiaca]|uniref:glycosyltransferase n=1 Tax=Sabulicella rubraurantiaca TaxID=2811429 RepID=UPI001A96290F|nr:glycosyltransferase [Sabulicella rubraurantiaca]